MKTEEEIKEKIKELRERKTHALKRTSTKDALILYNCIIALEWVLEDENELCS